MYFMEDTILPPGEKIRRIRAFLGAKQGYITGNKFTRNLISYIENGKTRLVRDTAEIIAENLMRIAEEQKNPIYITADYLMENELQQANRILEKLFQRMKEYLQSNERLFMENFRRAEEILADWDIPDKKAVIYELMGDFYYDKEDFHDSYIYHIKSLENYIRINHHVKMASTYSKLGRACIEMKNYQDTINLNNHGMLVLESHHIEEPFIMKKLLFNNAAAYIESGLYDEAIAVLDKLTAKYSDFTDEQRMDILISKGNCCLGKEELRDARKLLEQVVEMAPKSKNLERKAMAYKNLSDVYEKKGDLEKAVEYNRKSLDIREVHGSRFLKTTLLDLGKRYYRTGNYEEAEKILLKTLEEVKGKNDRPLRAEAYRYLAKVYREAGKDKELDALVEEVIENKREFKEVFFEAVYYYVDRDMDRSKELLRLGLEDSQ
ncbi:tetratricopeptide repeat protein [Thermotalea metallivorans]|uniref:Uncharacterized protein n=1 Tax=Thermotalea metallivorans TaxID=520762 RepID=A0A140L5W7_9FIRM|nr:tetratricopeptide repeat protein [Thermotalea metallivorans]KXG75942.1 hypothetical protein AN619_14050 [Thermotalea metallivorans]